MISFLDLPVYQHKNDILDALEKNQTIIVESPTGSGKTTQIPLILKEAGYDSTGIIGITQPRRIATLSVCEFIKNQLDDKDSFCAYTMRFADTSTKDTKIKIMTDGILLQEVKADPILSRYSVIMVDEAHERSLNIDFILGLLKEIAQERKDLKIIISSATINTKVFSEFFSGAPIISISGKPYPVDVNYVPVKFNKEDQDKFYDKIVNLVENAHKSKDGGDVLIFLPGEGEIKDCISWLYYSPISKSLEIYPLYGRLSKEEQERVFTPTSKGKTKVVVSTNIAETSLTIDGIRTVIDSGMAKVNLYNQQNFTSALVPMNISRASADQRKGRAGRTSSGTCYRLYSEDGYKSRPEFSEEEILHSDLAEVVLRMSELGIYNTSTFPFITQPKQSALKSAEETLITIGAIEKNHHLTKIGEMMIQFPLLPRLSRVIVEAILNYNEVLSNVITAVAFLSTKTPYILPPGEELAARDAHHAMSDKVYGDFVSMLTLYRKYTSLGSKKEKEAFTKSHYLDMQTMDEIVHIKGQLEEIVSKSGIPILEGGSVSAYFCCLASGLRQYVCKKTDRFSYRTITADSIMIHPGSAWFRTLPEYILAGEIVQTSKMYARTVSPLRPEWLERIDPEILRALSEKGTASKKKDTAEKNITSKNELDRYISSSGKKNIYIVPFKDVSKLQNRSGSKIYIRLGEYISKDTIKTNKIDREFSLVPKASKPIEIKNQSASIEKRQFSRISRFLDIVFTPCKAKKYFMYTSLKEKDGEYRLMPQPSLTEAVVSTLEAVTALVDNLPKEERDLREKAEELQLRIELALDINK